MSKPSTVKQDRLRELREQKFERDEAARRKEAAAKKPVKQGARK